MKAKTFTSMGSLHPVIFFVVVYVVALLLSVFICSSLFYTFNGSSRGTGQLENRKETAPAGGTVVTASTLALQR